MWALKGHQEKGNSESTGVPRSFFLFFSSHERQFSFSPSRPKITFSSPGSLTSETPKTIINIFKQWVAIKGDGHSVEEVGSGPSNAISLAIRRLVFQLHGEKGYLLASPCIPEQPSGGNCRYGHPCPYLSRLKGRRGLERKSIRLPSESALLFSLQPTPHPNIPTPPPHTHTHTTTTTTTPFSLSLSLALSLSLSFSHFSSPSWSRRLLPPPKASAS